MAFFLRLSCTCDETCQSVWPSNASLFASSTCRYLRLLASPFDQSFTFYEKRAAVFLASLHLKNTDLALAPDLSHEDSAMRPPGCQVFLGWRGKRERRGGKNKYPGNEVKPLLRPCFRACAVRRCTIFHNPRSKRNQSEVHIVIIYSDLKS